MSERKGERERDRTNEQMREKAQQILRTSKYVQAKVSSYSIQLRWN